ncbi:MAG: hypothetical protein ACOYJB_02260 [Christensenellaceae bacterium]|jgi:hypothetical protein
MIDDQVRAKCIVADSEVCNRLGTDGCKGCYIRTLKTNEQKQDAEQRWLQTLALLPENIDDLHDSDTCQFCKDTERKKSSYAMFEMAHEDPYSEKGIIFGLGKKVQTPVGSLVPLQAGICDHCRKAFRMGDIIQVVVFALFIVIGIIAVAITAKLPLSTTEYFIFVQIAILVGCIVVGYFVSKTASEASFKRAQDTVRLNLAEIPLIRQMLDRGWFFFPISDAPPRVSFSKNKEYQRLRKQSDIKNDEDDITLDNYNI